MVVHYMINHAKELRSTLISEEDVRISGVLTFEEPTRVVQRDGTSVDVGEHDGLHVEYDIHGPGDFSFTDAIRSRFPKHTWEP